MAEKTTLKWWSSPRTLLRHILGLDDTHHSIAMGTTVGMFIGMTPTVGIQMIIVVIVAFCTKRVFQFNRVAALITVYISNPVTMVPIYYMDYKVGTILFGGDKTAEDFHRILKYDGFAGWWETIVELFVGIGLPLIVGSLVVAAVCSAVTYPGMRWMLKRFHRRLRHEPTAATKPATRAACSASTDAPE
ncbi:MAG: DUF2062 domain-containing protein [Planctomycetaceae bacterium]